MSGSPAAHQDSPIVAALREGLAMRDGSMPPPRFEVASPARGAFPRIASRFAIAGAGLLVICLGTWTLMRSEPTANLFMHRTDKGASDGPGPASPHATNSRGIDARLASDLSSGSWEVPTDALLAYARVSPFELPSAPGLEVSLEDSLL